jgi:hypothetical protein
MLDAVTDAMVALHERYYPYGAATLFVTSTQART